MNGPRSLAMAFAVVTVLTASAFAEPELQTSVDPSKIPEKKRTKLELYVTAKEAAQALKRNPKLHLIDVRTRGEVQFLGIPKRANAHIPYLIMEINPEFNANKGVYNLTPNPHFAKAFEDYFAQNGLTKDSPTIIMCRSGNRTAKAVNFLADLGYKRIYQMVDGYEGDKDTGGFRLVNGWKKAGLPWSYKTRPDQVYKDPSW